MILHKSQETSNVDEVQRRNYSIIVTNTENVAKF